MKGADPKLTSLQYILILEWKQGVSYPSSLRFVICDPMHGCQSSSWDLSGLLAFAYPCSNHWRICLNKFDQPSGLHITHKVSSWEAIFVFFCSSSRAKHVSCMGAASLPHTTMQHTCSQHFWPHTVWHACIWTMLSQRWTYPNFRRLKPRPTIQPRNWFEKFNNNASNLLGRWSCCHRRIFMCGWVSKVLFQVLDVTIASSFSLSKEIKAGEHGKVTFTFLPDLKPKPESSLRYHTICEYVRCEACFCFYASYKL